MPNFAEITAWVRKNTLERFGPVRRVPPELVFELAFEGIQASPRHKSGIALRFPRMLRWRRDKPVDEIDTLDGLRALLAASSGGQPPHPRSIWTKKKPRRVAPNVAATLDVGNARMRFPMTLPLPRPVFDANTSAEGVRRSAGMGSARSLPRPGCPRIWPRHGMAAKGLRRFRRRL